jgi:hypothetical protein
MYRSLQSISARIKFRANSFISVLLDDVSLEELAAAMIPLKASRR